MDPVTTQWIVYAALVAAGWAVRHYWPQFFPGSPAPAVPAPSPPAAPPSWLADLEARIAAKLAALEAKVLGSPPAAPKS